MGDILADFDELVVKNLREAESPCRVHDQYPTDEILGSHRYLNVRGEYVSITLDVLISLLYCVVLKGWFAKEECIHDDSDRPNIYLVRMSLLLEDLWSNIVGSTTDCFLDVPFVANARGQPEVAYLGVHLVVDKNVAQLQVAMDDPCLMNIRKGLDDLADVRAGLELCQSFPSLDQILEGVVATVLKEDIDVLSVLEGFEELHDVLVLETAMDLDFNKQLVPLPLVVHGLLWDNFGGVQVVVLLRNGLVALGETTCAQQLAFSVADVINLVSEDCFAVVLSKSLH